MAAKKSFTNPAMQFITAPEEVQPQAELEKQDMPEKRLPLRETKSERMQLLVKPSTKRALKRIAAARGQSMNDLANEIIDEYAERQENK